MKFGKYEIIKEIGKGAMGVVYLAFDPIIERQVAIKTMNPQLFQDKEQRERFFREAKSAGILQHPNIVTVYDMGMEGDTPYIVMEYVEGEDLDSLIKSKKLNLDTAIKIMVQLCDALSYAHSKGIIHRDIKPSNIRVLPDNTIKIMDFGIAKKSGSDLTQTGVLLGTVSYMAPEQLKEGKVSPQSDQFSAGIVFYEMLTGDKCFQGDTITSVMYKIVSFNEHEINLTSVPDNIVTILRKMVSHNPENRFGTCREVSNLLERAITTSSGKLSEGTKTVAVPPTVPSTPEHEPTRIKMSDKVQKKRSYIGIIMFFLVIVIIISGVFFVAHKKRKQKLALVNKKNRKINNQSNSIEPSGKGLVKDINQSESDGNQELKKQLIAEKKEEQNQGISTKKEGFTLSESNKTLTKRKKKPFPERKPQKRLPKPPIREPEKEKEVFSFSNNVKKKERHLNFSVSQKEALKKFMKEVEHLSYPEKIAKSNALFNAGMNALGNGANRFAAMSFYKSIILNPRRKEAYAFLCVALAKMRAFDDIKKVLKKAKENGISVYDLKQNKMFDTMYNRLKQKGLLD